MERWVEKEHKEIEGVIARLARLIAEVAVEMDIKVGEVEREATAVTVVMEEMAVNLNLDFMVLTLPMIIFSLLSQTEEKVVTKVLVLRAVKVAKAEIPVEVAVVGVMEGATQDHAVKMA